MRKKSFFETIVYVSVLELILNSRFMERNIRPICIFVVIFLRLESDNVNNVRIQI